MTYRHFSVEEREKIQEMRWERRSVRAIAQALNRSPSSVSRELRRNFPPERRVYAPRLAHARALTHRTHRGRWDRLKNNATREYVTAHLKEGWSPEQIAGRIKVDGTGTVSHEAIYQFVYAPINPGSGLVKAGHEDLRSYLKRRHKRRVKKGGRRAWRLMKSTVPSIEARPLIVATRSRIGDWESDSVESGHHAPGVNTLVERKSGLMFVSKLPNRSSAATAHVIATRLVSLPENVRHTITFDNGSENHTWKDIEATTKTQCFFAHPYSSWERGTNENANGLIRWYFPKGTDFRTIPEEELALVERALNNRPRKRLGWRTPREVMSVALQG